MADFKFLKNPVSGRWTIIAPRRAKRPDVSRKASPLCPFCIGREKEEPDVYRVGGSSGDSNWQIRVVPNKFPFAPIHEIIIHSPDHHKNFDELPQDQSELIFQTYLQRYNLYKNKGQVYIFHNRGEAAGESLPHPHTQLTVIPNKVKMNIPYLDPSLTRLFGRFRQAILGVGPEKEKQVQVETKHFYLFSPKTSQWPDEVWTAPKKRARFFGQISKDEISDLAYTISRLIQILDLRHGHEFPFNFYIYPGLDWYLRLIPRAKSLGGFEIGTGIYINTQGPEETIEFIKEHFQTPDEEKIRREHQALYKRSV